MIELQTARHLKVVDVKDKSFPFIQADRRMISIPLFIELAVKNKDKLKGGNIDGLFFGMQEAFEIEKHTAQVMDTVNPRQWTVTSSTVEEGCFTISVDTENIVQETFIIDSRDTAIVINVNK